MILTATDNDGISRPKSREWIETAKPLVPPLIRIGISRPKSREWIETQTLQRRRQETAYLPA